MKECGKVFMLDDDLIRLNMYATFLRGHGLDVFATDNAYKMILYAREMRPSVFVLEVNMPIMNGWDVLEYLKRDVKLRDVPVVMLAMADEVGKAISLGADNFLLKPVEPIKLLEAIRDYCLFQDYPEALIINKLQNNKGQEHFVK